MNYTINVMRRINCLLFHRATLRVDPLGHHCTCGLVWRPR